MAVEHGVITSVVPPGGWGYPQVLSTGQTIKIASHSFEQLLADMLDFRRRHLELCGGAAQATIEVVRTDYKAYVCRNFRQNCGDSPGSPTITARAGIGMANYVTPIDRVSNWLAHIASIQIPKIDPALAAQRAQICAQCAMNVRWQTPCQPCNENVLVRTQNAKGSLATPYDRSLETCRIFGHHNAVAVWLTDTNSNSEQKPPSHCWKAQEDAKNPSQ